MKIYQKFCVITLCLTMCAVTGCTKGSSTQQSGMAGSGNQSADVSYVAGIIDEVREDSYLVKLSSYTWFQLMTDKCGTDYQKGDSIKVGYTGAIHHYDENMNRLEDDQFPLTGDKMYMKAEEYTDVFLWENDYSFYGTLEAIADMRDERGWFGDSIDTYFCFVPLEGEDEGKANQVLGDTAGFAGYASQINGGAGFARDLSMHTMSVKITYDSETMQVTKVEFSEEQQADIR